MFQGAVQLQPLINQLPTLQLIADCFTNPFIYLKCKYSFRRRLSGFWADADIHIGGKTQNDVVQNTYDHHHQTAVIKMFYSFSTQFLTTVHINRKPLPRSHYKHRASFFCILISKKNVFRSAGISRIWAHTNILLLDQYQLIILTI